MTNSIVYGVISFSSSEMSLEESLELPKSESLSRGKIFLKRRFCIMWSLIAAFDAPSCSLGAGSVTSTSGIMP